MLTARLSRIATVFQVIDIAQRTIAGDRIGADLDDISLGTRVAVAHSGFDTALLCRCIDAFFVVAENATCFWLVQPLVWADHVGAVALASTAFFSV